MNKKQKAKEAKEAQEGRNQLLAKIKKKASERARLREANRAQGKTKEKATISNKGDTSSDSETSERERNRAPDNEEASTSTSEGAPERISAGKKTGLYADIICSRLVFVSLKSDG